MKRRQYVVVVSYAWYVPVVILIVSILVLCFFRLPPPPYLPPRQSERPMTFETGEDFHISHTLRKYANIGSYVMPYKAQDDETKGSKYRGLSFVNAATTNRWGSAVLHCSRKKKVGKKDEAAIKSTTASTSTSAFFLSGYSVILL